MSTQNYGPTKAYKAGADLSAKQYFIVKLDTDQDTVVLASAGTDFLIGTIENKPKANENASVLLRSGGATGKVVLGGSVSAGNFLTADSAGKAVATTSGGDEILGRALKDGSAGDIIEYTPANVIYRTS